MRKRLLALSAVALAALVAAPADAGWLHLGDSIFQTNKASESHPRTLERMVVVPTDLRNPRVCVTYFNNSPTGSRGKVSAQFTIERDPEVEATAAAVERVNISANVKDNTMHRCRKIARLAEGDLVHAKLTFSGMPKLKTRDAGGDWASASISVGAELNLPVVEVEPDPVVPVPDPIPDPTPDPDPNPDPGNDPPPITPGALSPEDQSGLVAIAALAGGGAGVQYRLQTGNLHFIDYRDAAGNIFEFGPASTLAGAAGIACQFLPCGPGGGLSSEDQTAISGLQIWINRGQRRLGVRFESDGVYIDWQPPLAGNHTGPFPSIWSGYLNFCNIVGDCP